MAMDSASSCRVDRRGVGVEFNMCDEDGGESRFCVGVANFRQHRVWEVENVSCHCGFLVVKKNLVMKKNHLVLLLSVKLRTR
jgi:hypothetical protein